MAANSPSGSPRLDPWQEYRRRRKLLLWTTLAGLVLFLASFPVARARHSATPVYIGLGLCVALIAWASAPISDWSCPQCGEPFIHNGKHRNLFTRKCLHCQHPRWTDPV